MRTASSAGNRAVGSGGCADTRRARTSRPSSSARVISSTHCSRSAATRRSSASRSVLASSRLSSSRVAVSAPATTERRSRRLISSALPAAASARSRQEAALSRGRSSSAIASSASPLTSGRLADRARSFWASMAWRTAGMPPLSTCSAMGRCSGDRPAMAASRCALAGLSRLGRGVLAPPSPAASRRGVRRPASRRVSAVSSDLRSAWPRRARPSLAARCWRGDRSRRERSAAGRSPSRRGLRLGPSPSRPPRSERPLRRTRDEVTPSCRLGDPMISRRSGSDRFFSLGGSTDEMLMPSSSNSASARTTSPTLAPS